MNNTACTMLLTFPLTDGSDGRHVRPVRTYAESACSLGGWGYVPACRSGRAARCDGRDPMGR
jgi:hypothetical protein